MLPTTAAWDIIMGHFMTPSKGEVTVWIVDACCNDFPVAIDAAVAGPTFPIPNTKVPFAMCPSSRDWVSHDYQAVRAEITCNYNGSHNSHNGQCLGWWATCAMAEDIRGKQWRRWQVGSTNIRRRIHNCGRYRFLWCRRLGCLSYKNRAERK